MLLVLLATLAPYGAIDVASMPPRWCLACGGLWLTDGISNVVLFAPFGLALAMLGLRWWVVLLLSAGFSLGVEWLQSIGVPPARSAAWADVVANGLGGLVGVWVLALRGWLFPASWRVAVRLAWGWAAGVVLLFALTSAALGPRSGELDAPWGESALDRTARTTYGVSALPFTPGHGWFGGLADTLVVNGFTTTHRGTGPLMVAVSREPATVAMRVVLRGREEGGALVPIGYLHVSRGEAGDSSAVAFVGEEDLAAKLVVTRRAWDWGLAMPTLSLPGVFAGRSVADPRPVVLEAWSAPDTLRLSATSAAFTGSRAMALTPVIGWALIQTVFSIGGNFELLAHICWLAALMVPIGWWGIQAAARSGRVLGIAMLWLWVGAAAMPRFFGVAPIGARDWVIMMALLAAGAAAGRYAVRRS
ncbi:VanZ family protein [Gemmatimonas sp.]|uniref:VanZ family protein n=1 Tax=Gemmatimonas sp. TaxID=1962908 RepID=UPI00286E1931|nr:VanZ family protein [Gemmatimonas sp.]